jgi:hypothetical protein
MSLKMNASPPKKQSQQAGFEAPDFLLNTPQGPEKDTNKRTMP